MAQTAPGTASDTASDTLADSVDDIVVTARRAGAPMWTVTRGASTLLLVGSISGLPRDFDWRPGPLETAAARSQLILFPQEGRASASDLFRVIWRARTIGLLPDNRTTADYLSPDWQARLETVMASERDQGWRRRSLLFTGYDLMKDRAGFSGRGGADDATDVVRRSARKAHVPIRPVGVVRGDAIVDSLITAPQSEHIPCVQAAIAAAESGPDSGRERAEAWRAFRVAEVSNGPIEVALNQCWPWGDPKIAPRLHADWTSAIDAALATPGITMGVAPLRLLAEPDGVLDRLQTQGFAIDGPPWKTD